MHPHLSRAFFAGVVVILLQFALGAAAAIYFTMPLWAGALFLLGVPLGLYATRTARALGFPAIGLIALTGVLPLFLVDTPLFGRVVNLRQVDDIPADIGVAGYVAPGWRIDSEHSTRENLTAGRGNRHYGFRSVAPLVGDGWTPAHPVEVWVMGETRDSGRTPPIHPKFWTEPGGEYARLVGASVSNVHLQIQRAAQEFGLKTAAEPLIVTRRDTIREAMIAQYVSLARGLVWPLGLWAAMFGIAVAWRNYRARSL